MTHDFLKIIFERRSVRWYLNKSVPPSVLEKIIRAAADAPSAHNDQPWHFVVITSPETRNQLAQKMAEKYEQDMKKQGIPEHTRKKKIRRSLALFRKAPAMVVPFLANKKRDRVKSESSDKLEEVMGIQSVAAAVENLLLAAASSGLGACWYSAPLFCPEIVAGCLHVDDVWHPQALITLGYPEEIPKPKEKKALKEIMTSV